MNQNGQILLKTLDDMEEPASIAKIIKYVAKTVNVRPVDVKKTVENTLKAGVRHGYIQCDNNKFFTKPPIIPQDDDALSCTDTTAGDCAQCRKHGGKKRRSSRSRSRSRTHGRGGSRSRGSSRRRRHH